MSRISFTPSSKIRQSLHSFSWNLWLFDSFKEFLNVKKIWKTVSLPILGHRQTDRCTDGHDLHKRRAFPLRKARLKTNIPSVPRAPKYLNHRFTRTHKLTRLVIRQSADNKPCVQGRIHIEQLTIPRLLKNFSAFYEFNGSLSRSRARH